MRARAAPAADIVERATAPSASAPRHARTGGSSTRDANSGGLPRRLQRGVEAGLVAFTAAVLVALMPASESSGAYRWPPARSAGAPAATGARLFTPLLLARHTPARLSVDAPCNALPAALQSGERFTVAATAHDPTTARGMWLFVDGPRLRMGVGNKVLASTPWPASAVENSGCLVAAEFRGRAWQLDVDGKPVARGASAPPVVTGLFTELPRPAAGQPGVSIEVVTLVSGSSPSFAQIVLTVIAVAAGALALVLLIGTRRHRPRVAAATSVRLRALMSRLRWVDAIVAGALVAWWIVGPVLYDDGWVLATVLKFTRNGTFSNYYDIFDTQYPLGFVQFVLHFVTSRVSTSLLWMRFPVLLIGGATWALLRTHLGRLGVASGRAARGALACMFLLFWFAWLSTLRPEPIIAMLSAVALVAMQRFYRNAAFGALVVAVLAAVVAVSIHPEGVVAVAPLLVAVPTLWRWVHEHRRVGVVALIALGLVAATALVLLLTADSNLSLWRDNQHAFTTGNLNSLSWRDEFSRYDLLFDTTTIWGPVVRRATVVFASLAVVLFVTRVSGRRDPAYNLPVLSLVVAGFLMALTPSKWPWQLGALAAFGAVAVATEVMLLGREGLGSRTRNARSVVLLVAVVAASIVAWRGGDAFGDFAVVNLDFGRGGSGLFGVDLASPVPWIAVVVVTGTVILRRRPRTTARATRDRWLASSGLWAIPVSVGLVVLATLSLFVGDAFAQGSAWSLPRQQYDALTGHTCGMADDIGVADAATGPPLARAGDAASASVPNVLRATPLQFTSAGSPPPSSPGVDLGETWGSHTTGNDATGAFVSPWFSFDRADTRTRLDGGGVALYTAGTFTGGNRLYAQFGRDRGRTIESLGVERVAAPSSGLTWQPSKLEPPRSADRVRVVAVDAMTGTGGWLAFSAPRRVQYHALDRVLSARGTRALVGPAVRFYFPCAANPHIDGGVAQPPDYIVSGRTDRGVGLWPQSPTANLLDLYSSDSMLVRAASGTNVEGLQIDHIVQKPAPGVLTPLRT